MFRARDERADEARRLQAFVATELAPSIASAGASDADVAAVRSIDATFDPAAFLAAAAALFRTVRAAYNDANLDAVAGRLAPELTVVLGHQLHAAATFAHRLTMSGVDDVVPELRGVEASSDGTIRAIVRFNVTGRLGEVLLGADVSQATQLAQLPVRQWFEIWRMSRPAGVATPPPATSCPTCGAPASGQTHCRFCQALLVDGVAGFRVDAIECFG